MAETVERLVTQGVFDPSGILKGVDIGVLGLGKLDDMLAQINKSMPGLPLEAQMKLAARGIEQATQRARELAAALGAVGGGGGGGTPPFLGPAAPPIITKDKVAELKILSSQLQQSQVVADQFTGSVNRMNMAMLARSSGRVGDNGASFNRGLANLSGGATAAATAFGTARIGGTRLINTLASLAVTTVGVSGKLGTLAANLLVFGVGGAAVAALAATVLVAAKAWEFFTAGQREAAKATEENRQALENLQEQQKGPVKQAQESFDTQRQEVERLATALAKVSEQRIAAQQLVAGGVGGDLAGVAQSALIQRQVKLTADLATASGLLATAQRGLNEVTAASLQRGNDLVASLSLQAGTFGMTATQAQRVAVVMDTELTPAQRKSADALLNYIDNLERQKKAQDEAAKAAEKYAEKVVAEAKAIASAEGDALRAMQELADADTKAWADAREAASDYFKNVREGIDSLLTAEEIHLDFITQQIAAYNQVADAIFGVAQRASDIGLISNELANAVGAALDLGAALKEISLNGASFASVLGAVGAGIGVLGNIGPMIGIGAGPSRTEQLLDQNNSRLVDLKASLDQNINTLAGLTASLDQLEALRSIALTPTGLGAGLPQFATNTEGLERALAAAGMSIEEWAARIQRVTGLDILDEQGRVITDTLGQVDAAFKILIEDAERFAAAEAERKAAEDLATATRKAEEEMGRLADTINRQRAAWDAYIDNLNAMKAAVVPDLMDLRSRLTGQADDPMDQFRNAIAGLGRGLDGMGTGSQGQELQKLFKGFDLNDADARAAMQQLMLDYVNQMLAGTSGLEPEVLATFVDFLGTSTDILDSFNDSVQDATKSLTNMPRGINLAALEFQAQSAGGFSPSSAPSNPFVPFDQAGGGFSGRQFVVDQPFRGTDGASAPTVSQQFTGPILIRIEKGASSEPAEVLAKKIQVALKRQSMARFGTPDKSGAL